MTNRTRTTMWLFALMLVAAACGGSDAVDSTSVTTPPPSPGSTTTAPIATSAPSDPTTSFQPVDGVGVGVVEGWSATSLGQGTKPVLALDADGSPGVAFVLERLAGSIGYLDAAGGWELETVAEGYFYGPIGLTYDASGAAVVAYHDHQATSFQQDLGDLTIATRQAPGTWGLVNALDDGHDGWDSIIASGPDGSLHAAGIDPEQFGRNVGVEYYEPVDGDWIATEIGTGPVNYEFNVGLAVSPSGEPALTYYDDAVLNYASRIDGAWTIETVDADGDPGRYSSVVFDSLGNPHISYVDLLGPTTATVRYATHDGAAWLTSDVASLDELLTGFTGARRVTHVQVDSNDVPHIVLGDEGGVWYATVDGGAWDVEQLVERGDLRLGQLVTFALDTNDVPHIAFFEVTSTNPLDGTMVYITPTS